MRGANIVAAILLSGALGVCGFAQEAPGPAEVITKGAQPFSETWQDMAHRDAARPAVTGLGSAARVVREAPLRVEPIPSPRLSAPTQEAAFPEPGPLAPQAVGTSFITINLQDQFNAFGSGSIPPDTMGAVGPSHFVQVINSSVAIYNKTGARLSHVSLDSFFAVTVGGTTYPRGNAFDPRVLYDRRSGHWFACALEHGNPSQTDNDIILAVCRTSDPTTGTWDKYVIPVGVPNQGGRTYFTDFDTLGMDDNGVYFGMRIFPSNTGSRAKIAATGKASLIAPSPSLGTVTQWDNITDMYSSPQPAHNQDAVSASGRAWFVASSASVYANLTYRTLTWSGGTPSLTSTSTLTTPAFATPLDAPASGSTTNINVTDQRFGSAGVIRNNRLWACRSVGVNSSGGSTSADRTGCEWLCLNVTNATPTLVQSGRVYDSAASGPRFYYYPSIMVSGQGHVAMGFSGSKGSEFVGAYTCGRLSTDPVGSMGAVTTIKAGQASYQRLDGSSRNRWGDYSYTSVDPNDDQSIWTIQEYATNVSTNIWGTWTARLLAPAPTLANPAGTGCAGETGHVIALTGTGFYDPGAGYVNRLSVALNGGAVNGISNYGVVYNSATSVTVTFNIASNASSGARDIVLTNPDGQTATVAAGFTVNTPAAITSQPASMVRCTGGSATFCVTATGAPAPIYQWKKNGLNILGATSSCYTIPTCAISDSGSYTCVVTNSCGSVTSNAVQLAVAPCMSIPQAKQSSSGTSLAIIGRPVSAVYADCFYIEEPGRFIGIRVNRPASGLSIGAVVGVAGTVQTTNGERYIDQTLVVP